MVRPFPFLATALMLLALAFYIIAASTAHWLVSYQPNVQAYEGVYNTCWRQHDAGIEECRHVNNDCTADFSSPVDSFTLTDSCNQLRAVRAFVVLSIIFAGLAVVALYLLSFTKLPYLSLRGPAMVLSFIAGACGLIAWAIFIALSRDKTGYSDTTALSNYEYGFSFALLTAAWPLSWLALLLASIPWPYHPAAFDRSRYYQQQQQPSAAPSYAEGTESQEAERQRSLRAGGAAERPGLSERLWSAVGVTPDKRKGYAERWGGQYGGGYGEAQQRRESGGARDESLEEVGRLRSTEREGQRAESQQIFGGTSGSGGRGVFGTSSGSSGSGGGPAGGGMSSNTGGPLHPAGSSASSSEQQAESVPVRLHN